MLHNSIYIHKVQAFPENLFPEEGAAFPFVYCSKNKIWTRPVQGTEALRLEKCLKRREDRALCLLKLAAEGFSPVNAVFTGTSRGTSETLESAYRSFFDSGYVPGSYSPRSTFGVLSSSLFEWGEGGVFQDISQTCSSGLQALLQGMAWLGSGMGESALVAATEAPLTPFTLAMMKQTGICSKEGPESKAPVRPLFSDTPGTVLGEGAVALSISTSIGSVRIAGWGTSMENAGGKAALLPDGKAYAKAMLAACGSTIPDLLIMHAPGNLSGDRAELNALNRTFPTLKNFISTKGFTGHTLGASGLVNVFWAWKILNEKRIPFGYHFNGEINSILVNAMGFGGNAVSVLLEKTN
jgi:3-oxoacyl-[acyl-carrier-protein] synthase II